MNNLIFDLSQNRFFINLRAKLRNYQIGKSFFQLLASIINNKKYEDRFQKELLKSIKMGDIVWDIGANIGLYTQKFLDKVGTNGQVIAIEPSPKSAQLCREISEYGKYQNLLVIESALGSSNDIAYLNILEGETSPTNHLSKNTENTNNTIGVQVMTGDTLAKQLNQYPNFIKIDVEGFEVEVLKGMHEVLSSEKLHSVFIEVHFKLLKEAGNPYGSQTIIKILKDYNFKIKWIDFSHVMGTRA